MGGLDDSDYGVNAATQFCVVGDTVGPGGRLERLVDVGVIVVAPVVDFLGPARPGAAGASEVLDAPGLLAVVEQLEDAGAAHPVDQPAPEGIGDLHGHKRQEPLSRPTESVADQARL